MASFASGDCPMRVADSCFWQRRLSQYVLGAGGPKNFIEANGTTAPRTAVAIPLSARKRWRLHVEKKSRKSLRSAYFGRAEPEAHWDSRRYRKRWIYKARYIIASRGCGTAADLLVPSINLVNLASCSV